MPVSSSTTEETSLPDLPVFYGNTNTTSRAPSYSSLPLADEETIQYTPRSGTITAAGGTYTRKWKNMTLTLHNQPLGVRYPVCHRNGFVAGELEMKCPGSVSAVCVKLEGRVALSASDVGARVTRTVQEQRDLWGEEGSSNQCPGILSFSFQLPSSFMENGKSWKLPPSFEASFLGVPALFARSSYTLSILLTRVVDYRLVSWIKQKTYAVLVEHKPRNRPTVNPIPRFDSILSSIKSLPDEWTQLVSAMEVKLGSGMKPIDCHLLVPANTTYSLSDVIPFHIQLASSLGSLRELLPASSCLLQPRQNTETKSAVGRGSAIRVSIVRQIMVEIHGEKSSRAMTIGTGTVWPVPPTDLGRVSMSPDDVCLDWEGEVRCEKEVKSGGFYLGSLQVKDYIVLALSPPPVKTSQLLSMQIAHPVRFVTDPWIERETVHPQDY
ncbi:hypothetical protein P691DRAFT_662123 [Macrolepiota fuliginosa MF-IS2]|uniref:Uncharacterized protein n=1 Tax=Macrolepiota fuliginosa MF-IS2 TaxID=1400762 RepID=A0A9P5XJQ1_9AGAR|nr:hypothetical protein P691DRAFT_662123 [Macrolepiota fuliginosa MF-IS2]